MKGDKKKKRTKERGKWWKRRIGQPRGEGEGEKGRREERVWDCGR